MTEQRERFCPHCGRANPVNMPRCMNCGQRVGGTVLLAEQEDKTMRAPWWETSQGSAIPPPPQVREQIARQEAAVREQERLAEEQKRFHERLEAERKISAERLAAIRERRQERTEEKTVAKPVTGAGQTLTNCRRCGSPLSQSGHTFSFCLNCGADATVKTSSSATASTRYSTFAKSEPSAQKQKATFNVTVAGPSLRVTTATSGGRARADVNPMVPALLSFFFPGIGQFVNGQPTKGILLLLALFVAGVIFHLSGILLLVGRVLAALDAYKIADRRRRGGTVRVDEWDFGG